MNWNSGKQLRECLDSLQSAQRQGFDLQRIVVVDNASIDGSAEELNKNDLPLQIIKSTYNLGFGAACNRAAKGTAAKYLLFLNPDTRVFSESIVSPIRYMENPLNDRIGILGIQLVDEYGRIHRSNTRFPDLKMQLSNWLGLSRLFPKRFPGMFMSELPHDETIEVDQVMGAFFLVRESLFQYLGGFDDRYFVYYEDLDFSLRARKAGWKSVYYTEAQCFHQGGGISSQVKALRLFYLLRSRILFAKKHFKPTEAVVTIWGTFSLEFLGRVIRSVIYMRFKELRDTLSAYALLVDWLKKQTTHSTGGRM